MKSDKANILKKIDIIKQLPEFKKRFTSKNGFIIPVRLTINKSSKLNACVFAYNKRNDIVNLNINSSCFKLTESQQFFILAHEMTHILHSDYKSIFHKIMFKSRLSEKRADLLAIKICSKLELNLDEILSLFDSPKQSLMSKLWYSFSYSHPHPEVRKDYLSVFISKHISVHR